MCVLRVAEIKYVYICMYVYKSWCMHQFTTVFSNNFQVCSLISESGVDGSGLQTSHLAAKAGCHITITYRRQRNSINCFHK